MQEIIIAAISAGFPTIATIVTAKIQARTASKNAAKQSILQMILEDRMDWRDGKLPSNYQAILHEFDIYTQAGGNSYVADKVAEYKAWHAKIEQERQQDKTVLH
jgi:hypothetical protein